MARLRRRAGLCGIAPNQNAPKNLSIVSGNFIDTAAVCANHFKKSRKFF